jgi:hypothetical protein
VISDHNNDHLNSRIYRPIQFECYDWDATGKHDLIGTFRTTTTELQQRCMGGVTGSFELINAEIAAKKKKHYRNSGTLRVFDFRIAPIYSFIDYIIGGMSMNLMVAGEPNYLFG